MAKRATFHDAQVLRRARAARRRAPEAKQTAADAYREAATEIEVKMEALVEVLEAHHAKHQARPGDWSLVGDLSEIRAKLNEALAFLGRS